MNALISICASGHTGNNHCALTPTCKGWGCRFLGTPIEQTAMTSDEKAKLFSRVYREAKAKGVLDCPYYRPLFIDEVLNNIGHKND